YSFVRSGEAHGFSSIIDEAGNFIVGGPGGLGGQSGNFFTRLAGADAPWTKREIQKKMREEETFHFYMEDNAGENLVYLAPFKAKGVNATDWYFLMSVDNGYLEKSGGTVLILSAALPSLAILLMLGMMIYGAVAHHQTRAAREAARTRANFLSHMSHEIRTPLNGVIGLNHLIAKNIGDPEKAPQIKAWLAKSRFLAEYLLSLLDDVLDMSRLKAGGLAPRQEKFSIAKMNSDLVYMREADAESRDIRLILHQKLPWPKAIGDEERTRGVLTNILDNAIKFTGAGGTITLKVAQKKLKDSRVLTTWICSDTGQGISPDFLEKIFEPFAREARVRGKSPLSGAGLGLPISRELVLSMGGEISARSVVGEGTEVTVKIPFERASGEEDDERPESRDASRADGLKALLAEDA
ncbi:MAG: hypothetical protein K2H64_11080, partial [Desulfovibrio sp.]|nr:hypothetical protein [Desulfovibrio sp.]